MKFIGIILLLLTSIFLIACSANQASNNTSNSEIKELGKKYGGVYIFNKKFYDEIKKREAERKELSKSLGDKIRSNPRKIIYNYIWCRYDISKWKITANSFKW